MAVPLLISLIVLVLRNSQAHEILAQETAMVTLLFLLQKLLVTSINILEISQLIFKLLAKHVVIFVQSGSGWDTIEIHFVVIGKLVLNKILAIFVDIYSN